MERLELVQLFPDAGELNRLARLAANEQFGVRLEDAEDLLFVGDRFLVDDSPTSLVEDARA